LCELCGRGRTSLALGAVRAAQAADLPVAWVDGSGSFCPATAGVDLEQLVLVRSWPGLASSSTRRHPVGRALLAADLLLRSRAFALVVLDLPLGRPSLSRWFRLSRLAEVSRSWLLLLGDEEGPRTGSAAELALRVALRPVRSEIWEPPAAPRLKVTVLRHRGRGPVPSQVLLDPSSGG
jgi:hypothetical protein